MATFILFTILGISTILLAIILIKLHNKVEEMQHHITDLDKTKMDIPHVEEMSIPIAYHYDPESEEIRFDV